jgi:tetratricopeptide (TPR) repeat protein
MILRLSDSLSRGLVLVAAVVVAIALSFFALRSAIASQASQGTTAKELQFAVRLEPRDPDYWFALGHFQQFNLEEPDPDKSLVSLQKAVEILPQYTDAWLDLGTAYELQGDASAAREAYKKAKETYPASAEVSWRYGNYLLREGDLPGASTELKAALQADPKRSGAAFSRLYRAEPNIDEILTNVLPPVQLAYLQVIEEATDSKQLAVAQTVWMRLMDLHPTLALRDFERLTTALLTEKEFDRARQIWEQGTATMHLPPLMRPQGSLVWDPSFESGLNASTFAWLLQPLTQGVHTEYDSAEKLTGKQSLRITFDGKHNPNFDAACTLTVVTPGVSYRFSGWVKAKDITTDRGVGFRLRPVGNSKIPIVTTNELHGSAPWTFVDQKWTAGEDIHELQICVGREHSDDPDVKISGDAWIDDVNLVAEPAEHARR